ncbi:hypothetical protein SXCC_02864 [Gluconacetobacter sp. SXCC-1]|nr:hypothetical protein SXCC_02864 [Gluconacetobacter sp. SXCC-1]
MILVPRWPTRGPSGGKPGVFFVKVMRLADCLTDEAEIG